MPTLTYRDDQMTGFGGRDRGERFDRDDQKKLDVDKR
jgi:hypothetical protein